MPQPLGSPPASLAAVRRGAVGFTSTRGGTQLECVTGSVVCTIRVGNDGLRPLLRVASGAFIVWPRVHSLSGFGQRYLATAGL